MELREFQKEKIREYFKRISKFPKFKEGEKIRHKRTALVNFLGTPESIDRMTQLDLGKLVSNLWLTMHGQTKIMSWKGYETRTRI
ncbi:MAG: hypothetical protein ACXQTT_04210 [Candidatus Syntropharchaeia archaeon]